MAKFFFDLHECGDVTPDQEGVDVADLTAARTLAITAARDVMCGEISQGEVCLACFIEIRNETQVLDRVSFKDAVLITGL